MSDLTNEVRKYLEASLKKHNARAAKVETLLRGSNGSEQRAMNEVERSGESEEDVGANGEDQSSEEAGDHSLFVAEDEEEVSAVDSEVTGEAHQTLSAISSHKERVCTGAECSHAGDKPELYHDGKGRLYLVRPANRKEEVWNAQSLLMKLTITHPHHITQTVWGMPSPTLCNHCQKKKNSPQCMVYTKDGREKFYSDPNFQEFKCSNCIQPIRVPRCSPSCARGRAKGKGSTARVGMRSVEPTGTSTEETSFCEAKRRRTATALPR